MIFESVLVFMSSLLFMSGLLQRSQVRLQLHLDYSLVLIGIVIALLRKSICLHGSGNNHELEAPLWW